MIYNLGDDGEVPNNSQPLRYDESTARRETPLLAALLKLNAEKRLSFHMPGHRNSLSWPSWLTEQLLAVDTTELPVSFDLLRPEGAALEALKLAADFFGAGWTRFLTSGSTTAIFSLLAACPGRGGRILMAGNCHQSVMNASALLDLKCGFIPGSGQSSGNLTFPPQVAPADVEGALRRFGKCDAIIITSPDYYGNCADIFSIARLAHAAGAVLLVDEAHGAHFCAAPELMPRSALASGADASVQSAHKTLSSMTPGAMIHISKPAIDAARLDPVIVENMLRVFHTSSPSYVIAASLDFARWQLSCCGRENIMQQIKNLHWLAHQLPCEFITTADSKFNQLTDRDQTRLVIGFNDHRLSIRSLAKALQIQKVDIEMKDLRRLILIPSLDQPQEDYYRLADVCRRWLNGEFPGAGQIRLDQTEADNLSELDHRFSNLLNEPPNLAASPGSVLFGRTAACSVPSEQAAGRIAAEAIVPYPPGVPFIWPGERLNSEKLAIIRRLSENGLNLTGFADGSLSVLV